MFELDHLAVAAKTLEAGRAHLEEMLQVQLQPGGQHEYFGTHNMLLGLEDGLYLEVIAIDPAALPPTYPRWFDLDRFAGGPRLANWICRTDTLSRALKAHENAGEPVALARGDLRWQMAVPRDGILPFDNMFPALIEWQQGGHPAERLSASGCRLERLVISHPDAATLQSELALSLRDDRVAFEPGKPALCAEFTTPNGPRVLT